MSNALRVERAGLMLALYAERFGEVGEGLESQNATDLLADLRHFCAARGLSFYDALSMAEVHYEAETTGGEL